MTDFVHRFRHREPASEETSEQPMPNRSWSLLKGYTRALDELGPRSSGEGRPGMHEDAIRRAAETAREKLDQAIAATLEDARRQAEKITWDAEGLRRRAEQESKELRDGADAYAAKKRREAEKAAAKIVTEAEERARKVGRDELDRVAKRRNDLTQEIRFAEERLYQLSTGLDELALRLKQIVYPEQTGEPSNGRPTDEAPKEDLDSAVLEEQVQR